MWDSIVTMLLSMPVKRVIVSCMRDFLCYKQIPRAQAELINIIFTQLASRRIQSLSPNVRVKYCVVPY